jgi:hypothetical protein
MKSAWAKFALMLACTMAGARPHFEPEGGGWGMGWMRADPGAPLGPDAPEGGCRVSNASEPAAVSCAVLGEGLTVRHLVAPCAMGALAWLGATLPTLVLRGRRQVQGLRSCAWALLQLWLHMLLSYWLFRANPVWGFAWALHAPAQVLAGWAPPRRVLSLQALHPWFCAMGVACVVLFAWNTGAPAGVVRWRTGVQSMCGWSAHLVGVTGVDLVTVMMAPLGALVTGGRP